MLERAKTEYEKAKRDWERAGTLYKTEIISDAQYDKYKTLFEGAQASLKQAEEQLSLVAEGPRTENIEAARFQVARAKAALHLAEAQRLEIKMQEQELEMAKTDIDRARAELSLIETRLADTVAICPVDGIVLVKAAEAGEVLAAGTPIVTVGDINNPWLRGYINEPDLDRVRLRSKVKVITDSGKTFWGKVSFIYNTKTSLRPP